MPKIVHVNGICYEQVAPNSFYEADVENNICRHSPYLFPDHHVLTFKLLIKATNEESEGTKPDIVLIAKDYSEWWLVEVEMTDHHLYDHVLRQIGTLFDARYGSREAIYIHNKQDSLELDSLEKLITNLPPRLLVISNGMPDEDWFVELKRYNTELAVFETYRSSDQQNELFAINGCYIPKFTKEIISDCRFEKSFGLIQINNPEYLNIPIRGTLTLHFEDSISEWRCIDAQNMAWLEPVSRSAIPFRDRAKYQLVRHTDDSFGIVVIEN